MDCDFVLFYYVLVVFFLVGWIVVVCFCDEYVVEIEVDFVDVEICDVCIVDCCENLVEVGVGCVEGCFYEW